MLAVVIPTLNAAAGLPGALESLGPGRARIAEVVVADGRLDRRAIRRNRRYLANLPLMF